MYLHPILLYRLNPKNESVSQQHTKASQSPVNSQHPPPLSKIQAEFVTQNGARATLILHMDIKLHLNTETSLAVDVLTRSLERV